MTRLKLSHPQYPDFAGGEDQPHCHWEAVTVITSPRISSIFAEWQESIAGLKSYLGCPGQTDCRVHKPWG